MLKCPKNWFGKSFKFKAQHYIRIKFFCTKDWAWINERNIMTYTQTSLKRFSKPSGKFKGNPERSKLFDTAVSESLDMFLHLNRNSSKSSAFKLVNIVKPKMLTVLNPVYNVTEKDNLRTNS